MSLVYSDAYGGSFLVSGEHGNNLFRTCDTIYFPPPRPIREDAKMARRRICRENLSKMWPPSETTRRHRKEIRVTDLARPSIYLLFRDDVVVYVGQSKNPYARMAQHLKDKHFTHIRIMSCRKLRLRHWEEKLIKAYKPQYNIVHNLYK